MKARARPASVIPALALANLRHEWILTLCLVVALAAVIAPLLVLLGLKHGTIETLRDRLVEDPVFRELRPVQTREFAPEWFGQVQGWSGVGFLTPTILPLSSVVQVVHPQRAEVALFDLVPTAAGDPLLLENGGVIPSLDECVLSADAARLLGVQAGDPVTVRVTRARDGHSEVVEASLRVAAVLDARAGSLARVYAPLSFVLDVEAYKEGYGAPGRGWAGDAPEPFLSYDGAVLLLREPLPPIERTGLIINTGFARIAELQAEGLAARLGFQPPAQLSAYALSSPGSTITASNLRAIAQKLRGRDKVLLPWVEGLAVRQQGQPVSLVGLSLQAYEAAMLGLPATPWGGFSGRPDGGARLLSAWLPAGVQDAPAAIEVDGVARLAFSLRGVGVAPFERIVVPAELLGVLRTAQQRAVEFDPDSGTFRMARGGYRGFRMYADSIDSVPELAHRLREQGIEVIAEVEAIERIRVLDAGLARLFWLIAVLSIGGGVAVLVASLYAAVERRRRDLGVLRLVGLARGDVFFFPVVQGMTLAALGLSLGFAGYAGLAAAINHSFADQLAAGQRFCALPYALVPVIVLVTMALSGLASLAAAWRSTRIDPAEAIREQ